MSIHRLHAWLLSAMLAFAPAASLASQNQLLSPTTGTVSGVQLTNNYNNALDSLNTANSGTTAPTNQLSGSASLGNWWLNTTSNPYPLGMNDGSANWPKLAWLDATNHLWNVQMGGGTATLASAATVDLCSTSANYIGITGTTTITSFGSSCPLGVEKMLIFQGAMTVTYNGASLIVPGAANIQTSAGDYARAVYCGTGTWCINSYTPATGAALVNPAIDVGAIEWTFAYNVPSSKYLFAAGQPISRSTYATLMGNGILTTVQSVTRTNSSPTLTGFSDTSQINVGACVEGAGIPNSGNCTAQVLSTTSSTVTLNVNATSSGTANVQVFNHGNGDGSITFNLPDCRGNVLAGRDNMLGTAAGRLTTAFAGGGSKNPDSLGALLGNQTETLTQAQLPNVSFTNSGIAINSGGSSVTTTNTPNFGSAGNTALVLNGTNTTPGAFSNFGASFAVVQGSAASGGSGNAHPIVPPTLTANCLMRVLP